ncbi:benzoate 4-monooxygenase cytochrome P450 [Paramyrothecium foliicola]|nr:benzoate 4-monooxygenase cytochrome P450 [Paramyrothecium foliicola]
MGSAQTLYNFMDAAIRYWHEYQIYLYYLVSATVVLSVGVVFYRLKLSPLAKFPGPKLAAATRLYETYFQLVKGGTFTWQIDDLHRRYGPIVRISPWEIHIKDPSFYHTLYAGPGRHRNKDPWFSFIAYPQSLFSTESHEIHRPRRRVLGEFFKKKSVYDVEPITKNNLQSLCRHFSTAHTTSAIIELHTACYSFAVDVLSQYAFGSSEGFHYLDQKEIPDTWKMRMTSLFGFCRINRHFPMLVAGARLVPTLASIVAPPFKHVHEMEKDVTSRVRNVIKSRVVNLNGKNGNNGTRRGSQGTPVAIYPTILANPDVPESEKQFRRLQDDAIFLLMAGTDAPGQVLAITIFHVLNNPNVLQKLRKELFTAIPDLASLPDLVQLEALPYLTSIIKEGLRISSVVTTRLPRSAPDEHLEYRGWIIPAGTIVSMSTYFILRDPDIFPEPCTFVPERWDLCPADLQKLEKYLLPASKGTLGCLGQNLAWAWMYHVLAALFRRFDMVLYDTTEKNVDMARDNFIGQTQEGMNNVKGTMHFSPTIGNVKQSNILDYLPLEKLLWELTWNLFRPIRVAHVRFLAMLPPETIDEAAEKLERYRKDNELSAILDRYALLIEDYKRLKSDYEEEREGRERYKQLARAQERNPFALVLVDGDGYKFDSAFLEGKEEGGSIAAKKLNDAVKASLSRKGLENCEVVIRVYANLAGLSKHLARNNLCHGLTDFVDAGELKENADFKLRAMLRLYADNSQCKHIYFAACHDAGYIAELTPFRGHTDKFTLVSAPCVRFHDEFTKLGLGKEELPGVFLAHNTAITSSAPNETIANGGLGPSRVGTKRPASPPLPPYDSLPPDTGDASTFFPSAKTPFGRGNANGNSNPRNVDHQEDLFSLKRRRTSEIEERRQGRDRAADQRYHIPYALHLLPDEAEVGAKLANGPIIINKSEHRLDYRMYQPDAEAMSRLSRIQLQGKFCNLKQLTGSCPNDSCPYDHHPMPEELKPALLWLSRAVPCNGRGGYQQAGASRPVKSEFGRLRYEDGRF